MRQVEGYELERELGRGATAEVHRARSLETGQSVSLKIFHPSVFQNPALLERMKREMEVTLGLKHPHIVTVQKVIPDSKPPVLVMDYVDGVNLSELQQRLPYVLPELGVRIIVDVLKALEFAHSRGIIHRDVKPENILVSQSGQVYLTDFGLAKIAGQETLTQGQGIVGSIDYLAPEVVAGEPASPSSDLFSVGAVLYFLITGTRPFTGGSVGATLASIREAIFEPCQKRNPKVPLELATLVHRSLAKTSRERFASALEFRKALEAYLESLSLTDGVFNLYMWQTGPSSFVMESLERVSETLIRKSERALEAKDRNGFLLLAGHLSLKSPDSAALSRLMKEYSALKRRRRGFLLFWFVGPLLILGIGVGAYFAKRASNATVRTVEVPAEPVVASAPSVSSPVPVPSAPPVTKKTVTGTVIFKVDSDVKVYWDGRAVDPAKPLTGQKSGKHVLLMEAPDQDPIRAEVLVSPEKPTVINAER